MAIVRNYSEYIGLTFWKACDEVHGNVRPGATRNGQGIDSSWFTARGLAADTDGAGGNELVGVSCH